MNYAPDSQMARQDYGMTSRQEQPLLTEKGVTVTTARLVVGSATYPIANLTLVRHEVRRRILWAVVAGFFGLASVPQGAGVTVLGLALLGLAVWLAWPKHNIVITTAGTNVVAMQSFNRAFAERVVGAINHALTMR